MFCFQNDHCAHKIIKINLEKDAFIKSDAFSEGLGEFELNPLWIRFFSNDLKTSDTFKLDPSVCTIFGHMLKHSYVSLHANCHYWKWRFSLIYEVGIS